MLTTKNQVRDRALAGLIFLIVSVLLAGCSPRGPRSFTRGLELYEKGQYAEALEQFRAATTELSTNAVAWHYLGLAAQNSGQAAEAERAYARALTLDRDLVEARYNLGCLLLDQNRTEEAKAHFTTYHLRRPNDLAGCLKLGSAHLRSREALGAEKSFGEALRIAPTNAEALNGLGLARLQRGRSAEAVQYFSTALRHSPGYPPALLNLGIVRHLHLRDKAGALQAYQDYLKTSPPPRNSAAISSIVAQLQQELASASRPVTNQPTVAQVTSGSPGPPSSAAEKPALTPPPTAQATQAQATVVRQPTTISNVAKSPAPPTGSRVAETGTVASRPTPGAPRASGVVTSPPAAKPEVVRLPEEPAIKPARDVTEPGSTTQVASSGKRVIADPPVPKSEKKRGFLQSINPLNLFGGEGKQPSGTTRMQPATPAGQELPAPSEDSGSPREAPAEAKRWPKYTYRNPVLPPGRNRANAEHAFADGVKAQAAHRLEEAIVSYRKATQLDPTYFEAHYNLGLAQAALGKLAGALESYENALAVEPQSLDARYNFALTLRQANYIPDAVAEFKKLLRTYPNEPRANLALGNLYSQQLGQPSLARAHYLKVLQVEPRHPQANAIRYWLAANPK